MSRPVLTPLGAVSAINPPASVQVLPEYPFLPMSDVNAEGLSVKPTEVKLAAELTSGLTQFRSGDILLAKITPCFENGKITRVFLEEATEIGFGSTEFHVVRPDPRLADSQYVLHFLRLQSIRVDGARRMTGSAGQRRVPRAFLEELQIPLPTLDEQRRIAAILDLADALRSKRRESLAKLMELPQLLFFEMFRAPTSRSVDWPTVPFGELVEEIESGTSPVCMERPVQDEQWGVLKLSAVTRCEYDDTENKALPDGVLPDETLEVKAGDLLFTRKNTRELVGACALVKQTRRRLLLPDLIFRLRLRPGKIMPEYLHQLLVYPPKRKMIQTLAGGSAGSMPNISKARLATVEIESPPLPLQREFAQKLQAIDKQIARAKGSLLQLETLFDSLQHRAFKGGL